VDGTHLVGEAAVRGWISTAAGSIVVNVAQLVLERERRTVLDDDVLELPNGCSALGRQRLI